MIYHPAEDSYFLCEIVNKYLEKQNPEKIINIKILDMVTGSGIQSENLIKQVIKKQNMITTKL